MSRVPIKYDIKLDKWQRIFVNRSLNMRDIKSVGFDMDHTLLVYERAKFESLAFQETLTKLVKLGYPEELLTLEFRPDLILRGLLVDMERGNVLKVDAHKYVKKVMHGFEVLDKETRHALYNRESFKANEFLSVDTFFAQSEVQIFVEMVAFFEKNPGKSFKSYRDIYKDIRYNIDLSHADGSIKNHVLREPERFIKKDKFLKAALIRLIDGGKHLFLLTNSQWDYTNSMMSYILDDEDDEFSSWRDYFDLVIVGAGKPGFFSTSQPFYEVMPESGLLKPHSGGLLKNHVYQAGNAGLFRRIMGYRGDEILYVGDHIFGDIMQSKGQLNWRTLLVIEELDHELKRLSEERSALDSIQEKMLEREVMDEEIQIIRSKMASLNRHIKLNEKNQTPQKISVLEKDRDKALDKLKIKEQEIKVLERDIKEKIKSHEDRMHTIWGQTMKVGLERSRFADQVESFACMYTSRASNLRFYSPDKQFKSFHNILPHDV